MFEFSGWTILPVIYYPNGIAFGHIHSTEENLFYKACTVVPSNDKLPFVENGDRVAMILDTDSKILSFELNDIPVVTHFTNVPCHYGLYFAVARGSGGGSDPLALTIIN